MPVNKFGRSTTDRKKHIMRTGVTMSAISNSFVRRDGANTIIGDLNVTGNKITNVGDPASNQDVATKGYVRYDTFTDIWQPQKLDYHNTYTHT